MYKHNHMPALSVRLFIGCLVALGALASAGCKAVDGASNSIVSILSPYRMEVVQGNFVSKEQADLIQPGMTRTQVRTILGTPLLTDIFHQDRWDYVFTIQRKGVEPLQRRVSVFFENDTVIRMEVPEALLTEEEFVRHLEANRSDDEAKVPVLEATPEQLERAAAAAQAYRERVAEMQGAGQDVNPSARPAGYYPPLDVN